MPLYTDSYTTTAGSATDTRKIVAAIKDVNITADLDSKPESTLGVLSYGGIHPLFITGTYPGEEKIPAFAHPIYISGIRGKNVISTDLRFVLRKGITQKFSERIMDQINYEFLIARTVLDMHWIGGRSSEFISGFAFPAKVFGNWMAQVLRTVGLNPEEVFVAEVVALAYYYDLCMTKSDMDVSPEHRLDWVTAQSNMTAGRIKEILQDLKPMYTLEDCLGNMKKVIQNFQIQKMSSLLFLQKIATNWYGLNREKVMAVAVEHPPTWVALIHHCLSSKSFKNSYLAQVTSKTGRRNEADSFMRHFHDLFTTSMRFENNNEVTFDQDTDQHFNYSSPELMMECMNRIPSL